MAHAVDLLVDHCVFFDVGIRLRDIGFGLVIIVIADKIFDGVIGEKTFHLAVKLRRQRFVGRENEGRALRFLNDLRHGKGFAGAGHAEQNLIALLLLIPRRSPAIACG